MTLDPSTLKVENKVPKPKPKRAGKTPEMRKFLKKLKPGDSFVVQSPRDRLFVSNIAYDLQMKISVRTMEDGTIRIWRE